MRRGTLRHFEGVAELSRCESVPLLNLAPGLRRHLTGSARRWTQSASGFRPRVCSRLLQQVRPSDGAAWRKLLAHGQFGAGFRDGLAGHVGHPQRDDVLAGSEVAGHGQFVDHEVVLAGPLRDIES